MGTLIFNRDLTAAHVPDVRVIDLEPPGGCHPAAWARVWRFALTFDPEGYAEATGVELDAAASLEEARSRAASGALVTMHLRELRSALWSLYWQLGQGASAAHEEAILIDALLDAIYHDVSGGRLRPRGDGGPSEPGFGTFGASVGTGQHRFWFSPHDPPDRVALFDRVAGLLLREVGVDFVVSALYLYPPQYPVESEDPPTHAFMLLLDRRGSRALDDELIAREYHRLARLVIEGFADRARHHWPELEPALPAGDKFVYRDSSEITWIVPPGDHSE